MLGLNVLEWFIAWTFENHKSAKSNCKKPVKTDLWFVNQKIIKMAKHTKHKVNGKSKSEELSESWKPARALTKRTLGIIGLGNYECWKLSWFIIGFLALKICPIYILLSCKSWFTDQNSLTVSLSLDRLLHQIKTSLIFLSPMGLFDSFTQYQL